MTPEGKVLKGVKSRLDWYQKLGLVPWYERLQAGMMPYEGRYIRMASAGTPDVLFLVHYKKPVTYIVFGEVKSETGKQSEAQIQFESQIKYLPNVYYKIFRHPRDVDNIVELLTGYHKDKLDSISI